MAPPRTFHRPALLLLLAMSCLSLAPSLSAASPQPGTDTDSISEHGTDNSEAEIGVTNPETVKQDTSTPVLSEQNLLSSGEGSPGVEAAKTDTSESDTPDLATQGPMEPDTPESVTQGRDNPISINSGPERQDPAEAEDPKPAMETVPGAASEAYSAETAPGGTGKLDPVDSGTGSDASKDTEDVTSTPVNPLREGGPTESAGPSEGKAGQTQTEADDTPGQTPDDIAGQTPAAGQTPEEDGQVREYGPIRVGDSLGKIAKVVDPDGRYDRFQLMWGIFVRNSQAFAENNINLLRTGVTIIIPYKDELARIDPDIARREIMDQIKLHRQKLAEKRNVTSQKIDTARDEAKRLEQENRDLSKRLSETEHRIQQLLEENRIKSEQIQDLYDKAGNSP